MEFNYAVEKRKFEQGWAKTEALYRKHGMTEKAIQEMHEYDWDMFKASRIEAMHTQEIESGQGNENWSDMDSPLLDKFFGQFTCQYDTFGTHSRYWWMEEIEDVRLLSGLVRLTEEDKRLLTLYLAEGYAQKDCADILHIDQGTFSRKLKRILGKFTEK